MPTFDIIMVTWNRVEYTKRTVASLISSGAFEQCQRFIVVDNYSLESGMKEFIDALRHYQKTFVITRPKNDGWATAVNDGLGLSRAEYVLIINNDVEFQPDFIKEMFHAYNSQLPTDKKIGIVGVWSHTSHAFVTNGITTQFFREMDNVPAVGWLIPKSAMEKVGMLTEKGPHPERGGNGEDTDYVMRMKQTGYLTGVTARDVGTHITGY